MAAFARDDVAAAAVLTSDGHDGRTYDVTGGEALKLSEIAAQLGASLQGRDARGGVGPGGELATVSDTARRFAGREPLTLAQV